MSNKLKTASSLSADSTEVRYQKALKEINKLIGVNTELREEMVRDQEVLKDYRSRIEAKEEHLTKTMHQRNNLENELTNVVSEKNILYEENQLLKKELERLRGSSNQSFISRKNTKEHHVEEEQQKVIGEMEKLLESRDSEIKELKKKISSLEDRSKEFGQGKFMYTDSIKFDLNNNGLTKKLSMANDYINQLGNECADLKNKLMKLENRNSLLTARSVEAIPLYSPSKSPRNKYEIIDFPPNSAEVLKRYRKLEEENKKLLKKNMNLKNENEKILVDFTKISQEQSLNVLKLSGYEQLIKKQQEIISKLHEDFSLEVQKMTNNFKQKLETQRESFSPGKMADNVKIIENLQAENKQVKKKFQLCSIELTKCFKTLEVYKEKLTECEKDYQELAAEREQLIEKLTRNNQNHSPRERRASICLIGETDRRNSMGETSRFNFN